jgi:hypothetical protein
MTTTLTNVNFNHNKIKRSSPSGMCAKEEGVVCIVPSFILCLLTAVTKPWQESRQKQT